MASDRLARFLECTVAVLTFTFCVSVASLAFRVDTMFGASMTMLLLLVLCAAWARAIRNEIARKTRRTQ
jgi:hypothetical protein